MYSYINSLRLIRILLIWFIISNYVIAASAGNFNQDIEVTFGDHRAKILNGGQQLTLSLDKYSGSGFRSKNEFLLGRFDINMKLVPGNSAGTVTTFYLSSGDHNPTHDEIDYEFLGNSSGEPYTLHTNVYTQGKGNREQQFYLWFDPTHDFHTYSIVWNHKRIIFLVDETPIRVFNNLESIGVPYPNKQPMRIISSLWNADDWATQGGKVRADWSQAPFVASYSNFSANANCVNGPSCPSKSSTNSWANLGLDDISQNKLRWVQQKFMIYNYCSDTERFWQGLPLECKYSKLLGN